METTNYKLRDFLPLIIIFITILFLTIISQYLRGTLKWTGFMNDFMGFFFLVFGSFKIINLPGFVEAYQTYDIIAQRSIAYAYLYPFIEVFLGFMYLAKMYPFSVNLFTFVLMVVSSIGVGIELAKGKKIICACLGVVFKIPMTWVTLFEDLLMATMAFLMLLV